MTIHARFEEDGYVYSLDDDRVWWALCKWPERPPDSPFVFHHGCPPCALALEAVIHNGHWKPGSMPAEEALARARGEIDA